MAKGRRRRGRMLMLALPSVTLAAVFAVVAAENMVGAAIIGAIVGLLIGIALLGFPNLDRAGPSDTDSLLR